MTNPANAIERLAKVGFVLPDVFPAIGNYSPITVVNGLAFVASHGSISPDGRRFAGKVPSDIGVPEAREAACLAALNALATIEHHIGLENVLRIVRLTGMVNGDPGFEQHPAVIDGASDLLNAVFPGEGHARTAVGVGSMPLNLAVAIELVLLVKGSGDAS